MGQESARHGPMRYCGRDHCFKLLDLARTKGSLCGWGRGLWRWGAVLGESHGSCPFRLLDMTRARPKKRGLLPKEEMNRIKANALARPITVVDPAVSESGKNDLPYLLKRCWLRKNQRLISLAQDRRLSSGL
ncbi:hypothetical protein ACFX1T_026960 [Malus domestica]